MELVNFKHDVRAVVIPSISFEVEDLHYQIGEQGSSMKDANLAIKKDLMVRLALDKVYAMVL